MASRRGSLAGLAVPGMPRGSPGMEMPDGAKDAFDVLALTSRATRGCSGGGDVRLGVVLTAAISVRSR